MMVKTLLTLALLALATTNATAADRWGRSSYGTRPSGYNNSGGFNSYGSRSSYGTRTYLFPQDNTMILQTDVGGGTSVFQSGPMTQYGASNVPVYTPYQRAANKPWFAR